MDTSLTLSLPAATTTVIPADVKRAIAEFRAFDLGPPRDILRTDFAVIPLAVALFNTAGS